jgi:tellurite resistance-related uncharacterized protein
MKRLLFFGFAFFLLALNAPSQVLIQLGPPTKKDAFSSVNVYGSDGLSRNIPYSQVKGSPFWNDNWMKAMFYDRKHKLLGTHWAKFNFVAQEVHYLDSAGNEKAVPFGILGTVIFLNKADSVNIATVFRTGIQDVLKQTQCKECYVQELNQGHTKLLKITQRVVRSEDSLFGTYKTYYFTDVYEYFVQSAEQYNKIRKLIKEAFFSFIPGSSLYNEWIKTNKLSFKKEEDYLIFLQQYNATYQKD